MADDFPHADLPESLTRREVEVLRLIARGLSNREIAQALGTEGDCEESDLQHPLQAGREGPHPRRPPGHGA
ncbi:helix-turn-helix domain-containing protein [Pyxidicoccus trucidator]|uniref:helix-turn-helix domain-containing protein n=1 Tax=Pyxidicoccus trucidator TaxID=2709662 RepID=UPI001F0729B3|nr:helix-turn-helix transcriptional regulator [Pyxidicoccus trucidator]